MTREFRRLSGGTLIIVLVALGLWATRWGPDDLELSQICARTDFGTPLTGEYPTAEPADIYEGGEATYPVVAPHGSVPFGLCLSANREVTLIGVTLGGRAAVLDTTVVDTEPRALNLELIGPGLPGLALDVWAEADHCSDGWAIDEATVEVLNEGKFETHEVPLNGNYVFTPDPALCAI